MRSKYKKKSDSKIKKVILAIILASMPLVITSCTVIVVVSSVTMNFFGSSSVDENLTEEENNRMLDEVKTKTEWINNYSTFELDGDRIGQLCDYYGTDSRFKIGWAFTLAYLKYKQINNNDSSVNTIKDVQKKIEKAATELAPKFIYIKDKIITVRDYTVIEYVPVSTEDGDTVYVEVEVAKQDINEEERYFITQAQNIQGSYVISYRSDTQVIQGVDETITVTKPVIEDIKQIDKPYVVLKHIIRSNTYDEDIDKATDGIISIAYNYLGVDANDIDVFYTGAGTFTGIGEAFYGGSKEFIDKVSSGSIKAYEQHNILPSITIAQAILESGWGKSGLTARGNNLFGVKAFSSWGGQYVEMATKEYTPEGVPFYIIAKFRAYSSWDESIMDHSNILLQSNFAAVRAARDYREAAYALSTGGYATDPNYPLLIISTIEKYNLNQYDTKTLVKN